MRLLRNIVLLLATTLALSSCLDAYEERGLCSYFGACEWGLATELDNTNYCKELGSCSDPSDQTEYTISGKPTKSTIGGGYNSSGSNAESTAGSSSGDGSE